MTVAPAPASADDNAAGQAARAVDRASAVLENATTQARLAALRLQAATAAMPAAQRNVAVSRGAVAAAITAANTAGRRANAARAAYARVAGDFQQAQDQFADARARVDQIAQATYMGSTFSRINVLVEATGPADIMDRLSLVDQLMRTQNQDVDRLIRSRAAARSAQDRAGLAKREAEEAEAAAKAKVDAARGAQAAALRAKQALTRLMLSRQAALRIADAQRAAVLARYRAAVAEERRIRTALRGWSVKSGGGGRYTGGRLLMPVNGWKSSDFGERYDPFYRVWQLHAGTDFAAPRGMPIHAAAAGHVIRAGWSGGYGNYTCISHGRLDGVGFQTCYGHQSAILVHVGEYVRRGEVIGRVGTTGASTGNHLHFETRFNGVPRNPLQYLPSCLC
ncbi:M23 family metallopeptidase [Actinoplanes sp. CA-030573]|uniref:M23 family metallopeptidase n=1 Tax=Actinoplanes sp. CA-030573 TaxID=3239898 RepID=UPI003D920B2F